MVLAALIIGIIALVVAILTLPTTLQMFYGQPKLRIGFSFKEMSDTRVLETELFNLPVNNRLLKWFGVRRITVEDMMSQFTIEEYDSRKVILPLSVATLTIRDGTGDRQRISLVASLLPAVFGIACASYTYRKVFVWEKPEITLPPGKYRACIEVLMGDKLAEIQNSFVVSETHPFVCWNVYSQKKKQVLKHKHIV